MVELKILFKSILRTIENLPTHLCMSFMMDVTSRRRKYTGCPAQMNSFALIDVRTCFAADTFLIAHQMERSVYEITFTPTLPVKNMRPPDLIVIFHDWYINNVKSMINVCSH